MKAYELLDAPEKWCQGVYAITADGRRVMPAHIEAVRWCASGAIEKVCGHAFSASLFTAKRHLGADAETLAEWNDAPGRTWAEVHGLLKELDI